MQIRERPFHLFVLGAVVAAIWLRAVADTAWLGEAGAEPVEIAVTSQADNGPGTLRAAIFEAIRADGPATIRMLVARVDLTTPLPPLSSRHEITLRSDREPRAIVDGTRLRGSPALDLRGDAAVIERAEIRMTEGAAIRVSGGNVRMIEVALFGGDIGVAAAGAARVDIQGSTFAGSRIGVEARADAHIEIIGSSFNDHDTAGIWTAGNGRPSERIARITQSRFERVRYGIVAANAQISARDNEIQQFSEDGILIFGGVLDAMSNRLHHGRGAAIRAIGIDGGRVVRNDIHENGAIGIILQSGSSARVDDNRIYRNSYGIVTMLNSAPSSIELRDNLVVAQSIDGVVTLGDSPLIANNRAQRNAAAGIRIFHLIGAESSVRSSPLLAGNVLTHNGSDEPIVADYPFDHSLPAARGR